MSQLDQPAFPGGQMQELSGKYIPNYAGFTKRELLHVIAATIIYQNDDKLISIREASKRSGESMEATMITAIHGFVEAVEKSIAKENEYARQEANDSD